MIECIDHVNIVVRDLPRMAEFYRDVLGCEITKDVVISGPWIDETVGLAGVEARVVYLELSQGPRIELIQYYAPQSVACDAPGSPHQLGIRHIALRVTGIDHLVERLGSLSVPFQSTVHAVPDSQVRYSDGVRKRLVYFRDPEANILEFCEYK